MLEHCSEDPEARILVKTQTQLGKLWLFAPKLLSGYIYVVGCLAAEG